MTDSSFVSPDSYQWELRDQKAPPEVKKNFKLLNQNFLRQSWYVHCYQPRKAVSGRKQHLLTWCKHFPALFLYPKASCWLSCAAFQDEKAISSSIGLWNGLPFKSVFGKCKEKPFGKFMGQQTPQLEWPLSGQDRNTDELGWHAQSVSQSLPVCAYPASWGCAHSPTGRSHGFCPHCVHRGFSKVIKCLNCLFLRDFCHYC